MKESKNAVVIGASYGLGRAVAIGLARVGYDVALVARGKDGLLETQSQLNNTGQQSLIVEADISKPDDVDKAVAIISKHFDMVHLVWHGASPFTPDTLETVSVQTLRDLADTTFFGTLLFTKKLIPLMKAAKRCRVFIANTTWALSNATGPTPFSSAKLALIGLQQGLNNELMNFNIYVTTMFIGQVASLRSIDDSLEVIHKEEGDIILLSEVVNTVIYIANLQTAYVPSIVLRDSSPVWKYDAESGDWHKNL